MLLLLGGVAIIGIRNFISRTGDQLPQELALLKKMGIATEPDDLAIKPKPDPAGNAAPIYQSIFYQFDAIKAQPENKDLLIALSRYGTPRGETESQSAVQSAVNKFAPIFNDAEKLLSKPYLDYKYDYNQGFNLLFPQLSQHRQLAQWLTSRTKLQAATNDPNGALKSVRILLRMAEHLRRQPALIGSLVCISENAFAATAINTYLQSIRNNPPKLVELQKALLAANPLPDPKWTFASEMVLGRKGIQGIRKFSDVGGNPDEKGPIASIPWGDAGIKRMFEANYVRVWRQAFEKMPKSSEDWRGIDEALSSQMQLIEKDSGFGNTLNKIIFPVFSEATLAFGKAQAERKLYLLATELLIKRPNGLPADLKAFGNRAIDPLSNKPFGYARQGRGFRIWSVGRDLKDDGGVLPNRNRSAGSPGPSGDMVLGFDIEIPIAP